MRELIGLLIGLLILSTVAAATWGLSKVFSTNEIEAGALVLILGVGALVAHRDKK